MVIEYSNTPRRAMEEPIAFDFVTGLLNTNTDVTMITTLFTVFATACVMGCTELSALNATSW